MKNVLLLLISIVLIAALAGCEGYRCGDSWVLDRLTDKPLDSVFCEAITGIEKKYTDSTGKFALCNRISGCVPHCKDITIRFSKPGYKTTSADNPDDAIIYLER